MVVAYQEDCFFTACWKRLVLHFCQQLYVLIKHINLQQTQWNSATIYQGNIILYAYIKLRPTLTFYHFIFKKSQSQSSFYLPLSCSYNFSRKFLVSKSHSPFLRIFVVFSILFSCASALDPTCIFFNYLIN